MASPTQFLVVTSIHPPTEAVLAYADRPDWRVVLVGDRKGPVAVSDRRIDFLDLERQKSLGFEYAAQCPENHYARKNVGYLYALSCGAEIIAETDDDNFPLPGWGREIDFSLPAVRTFATTRYFNVYREFTDVEVWPRGFPLREVVASRTEPARVSRQPAKIAVWQELADDDPDVDAIYRLTRGGEVRFHPAERLVLERGTYCPFNSQNTFWCRAAFAALFLPGTVSMRYCDILRGYVAQRLFWQQDLRLGFGPATVRQLRNQHDLMRDFADEVTMYREIESVVNVLESREPAGTMGTGLVELYETLAGARLVPAEEVVAVKAWQSDLRRLGLEP